MNTMQKLFSLNRSLAAAAVLAFPLSTTPGLASVVVGDPSDYESRRQQIEGSPSTVSSGAGDAQELRVSAEALGGFLLEEARPIFQFDLSLLAEPPASGTFSTELLSRESNLPFGIEIWGTDATRDGPLAAEDSGAAGQFASGSYVPARMGGGILLDENTAAGTVSADITDYLTERYDEYLAGGDSWIYLRLQPQSSWSPDDNIQAAFAFASADHPTAAFHPRIETVAIPEPAAAGLLAAGAALGWLIVRRRLSGSRG